MHSLVTPNNLTTCLVVVILFSFFVSCYVKRIYGLVMFCMRNQTLSIQLFVSMTALLRYFLMNSLVADYSAQMIDLNNSGIRVLYCSYTNICLLGFYMLQIATLVVLNVSGLHVLMVYM